MIHIYLKGEEKMRDQRPAADVVSTEIMWRCLFGFFDLIQPRLGAREASNSETSMGTDSKDWPMKISLSLIQEARKEHAARQKTFRQYLLYSSQNPQRKTVVSPHCP